MHVDVSISDLVSLASFPSLPGLFPPPLLLILPPALLGLLVQLALQFLKQLLLLLDQLDVSWRQRLGGKGKWTKILVTFRGKKCEIMSAGYDLHHVSQTNNLHLMVLSEHI